MMERSSSAPAHPSQGAWRSLNSAHQGVEMPSFSQPDA